MTRLLLVLWAMVGLARADHLTSVEPASALEWNVSIIGTWGRIQFNQHLASHNYGRGATFLHVVAAGNVRAPWSSLQQPCRYPITGVGCATLIPDAGDVLLADGDGWTLDAAEPVRSLELGAEVLRYQHITSSRPFMARTRVVSVPTVLVWGGRVELTANAVEAKGRRLRRPRASGSMEQLRAGPSFGAQWGWVAGTATWTPVGAPLGARVNDAPDDPGDRWATTALAPSSFSVFVDMDFPVDRKGAFDWISPELRFRRTPLHAAIAGGPAGEQAWVHELTWQLVAIVY